MHAIGVRYIILYYSNTMRKICAPMYLYFVSFKIFEKFKIIEKIGVEYFFIF